MLVSGIWCIATLEYFATEDQTLSPWILNSLKPIQMSSFDHEEISNCKKKLHKNRVD